MRERLAFEDKALPEALDNLKQRPGVIEGMILSTCNRVEVSVTAEEGADVSGTVEDFLADSRHVERAWVTPYLYRHDGRDAIRHLFRVAASLDSMVVGEPQILGQLRAAYTGAEQAGAVGSTLHELAQQALRVGKRVHAETGIDAEGASVVSEALTDAAAALAAADGSGLAGRHALVLGTGSMGGLAAAQLRRARVAEIVLANRTQAGAQRLAALCEAEGTPARAVSLNGMRTELAAADLVVCCTGAVDAVLGVEQVADARRDAPAPLVVCDLGLPRDVEAAVGELPGVTLLDLTTLQRRLERGSGLAGAAVTSATERAQRIVAEEVRGYLVTQRTAEVTPTVTALRTRAAEVVDAELLRLDGRLPGLDVTVRDELARTVRRVVDKLLHAPTVRVKQLAEVGGGQAYADALRELFELDPQAAAAVTATVRATDTSEESTPDGGAR
ncbi:MAG: glutamyl-tRNA reductase [Pseudonocardiaceae bacterium]